MKTLVIVSHSDIQESSSQKFLKDSFPLSDAIIYHHLESIYSFDEINVKKEQELLTNYQRIIFQFPFYWYSAPAMLKHWLDEVLTEGFAYGPNRFPLKGKELGLVMTIGVSEKEYQVGGREGFTISALTTPYQAMAKKLEMSFLKPFLIYQFQYMDEKEKMRLLIDYQQYLMIDNSDSLKAKESWFIEQISQLSKKDLAENDLFVLEQIKEHIQDTRMELDEIQMYLDGQF